MKPGLLVLPFLALLIGAFGTTLGSAFPEAKWLVGLGWAAAAALIAFWVVLDLASFKAFFLRKGTKYGAGSGLVVLLTMLIIIGAAVLSTKPRFNKSYDATKAKINTLSDQSAKIVEAINKRQADVQVIGYFQDDQVKQQFIDLLSLYHAKGAKITAEYVDPQRDPTRAMAEKITSGNTVVVKLGDQESRVTTFTEEKLTNGFLKVLKESSKKIYFTKGHGEGQLKGSEATGYSQMVTELEGNRYTVNEVSLLEEAKIPDDANLLVIAGPKYDFKEEEARFLEDYLKRGGALLVMVDAMTSLTNLNNSLNKFGIKINNDLLILRPDDPRAALLGQNNAIVTQFDDFSPVTRDFAKQSQVALLMPNTRSLDEVSGNANAMKVTLAAKTADVIIRVKDVLSQADLKNLNKDRIESGTPFAVVAVAAGKPSAPAMAKAANAESSSADPKANSEETKMDASTGLPSDAAHSKEIRLVVVGSAGFAANAGSQSAEHRDFFMNSVNYLLQDEDFISIRPKDAEKSTIKLTSGASQLTLMGMTFIYPFVFLCGGLLFWLRRRRA